MRLGGEAAAARSHPDLVEELAGVWMCLGNAYRIGGDALAAQRQYDESTRLLTLLPAEAERPSTLFELARSMASQTGSLADQGQHAQAVVLARDTHAVLERLAAISGGLTELAARAPEVLGLWVNQSLQQAQVHKALGQPDESAVAAQRGLQLAALCPVAADGKHRAELHLVLSWVHFQRGHALVEQNLFAEAAAEYRLSTEHGEQIFDFLGQEQADSSVSRATLLNLGESAVNRSF
jgi:hypothetical protein